MLYVSSGLQPRVPLQLLRCLHIGARAGAEAATVAAAATFAAATVAVAAVAPAVLVAAVAPPPCTAVFAYTTAASSQRALVASVVGASWLLTREARVVGAQ